MTLAVPINNTVLVHMPTHFHTSHGCLHRPELKPYCSLSPKYLLAGCSHKKFTLPCRIKSTVSLFFSLLSNNKTELLGVCQDCAVLSFWNGLGLGYTRFYQYVAFKTQLHHKFFQKACEDLSNP